MRRGAESAGRGARNWRDAKRARRDDSVWLLASNTPTPSATRATTGALALDQIVPKAQVGRETRRCALIIDHDPALAEALAIALQRRYAPQRSVRFIRDSRLLPTTHAPDGAITVIDASVTDNEGGETFRRLLGAPGMADTEAIYIASTAITYQLSQRGVNGGIVLRAPHSVNDIVSLVSESLAEN
jgi:hypothetical protein